MTAVASQEEEEDDDDEDQVLVSKCWSWADEH